MKTYYLMDTFNGKRLSNHRTITGAVKAQARFSKSVKRANGRDSYIPTRIFASDGTDVSEEAWAAKQTLARL